MKMKKSWIIVISVIFMVMAATTAAAIIITNNTEQGDGKMNTKQLNKSEDIKEDA